jgi:hypothetical protein
VRYEWRLNGGGWNRTNGTSASVGNNGAGNYAFDVRAFNTGGGAEGPVATSNTIQVSDPPPPPPPPPPAKTIILSRGAPGPLSGTTYYNIDLRDWPAGSYGTVLYCNGSSLITAPNITVGADGNGSYRGNTGYCGYNTAWVTVDGKKSDVQDWSR